MDSIIERRLIQCSCCSLWRPHCMLASRCSPAWYASLVPIAEVSVADSIDEAVVAGVCGRFCDARPDSTRLCACCRVHQTAQLAVFACDVSAVLYYLKLNLERPVGVHEARLLETTV